MAKLKIYTICTSLICKSHTIHIICNNLVNFLFTNKVGILISGKGLLINTDSLRINRAADFTPMCYLKKQNCFRINRFKIGVICPPRSM